MLPTDPRYRLAVTVPPGMIATILERYTTNSEGPDVLELSPDCMPSEPLWEFIENGTRAGPIGIPTTLELSPDGILCRLGDNLTVQVLWDQWEAWYTDDRTLEDVPEVESGWHVMVMDDGPALIESTPIFRAAVYGQQIRQALAAAGENRGTPIGDEKHTTYYLAPLKTRSKGALNYQLPVWPEVQSVNPAQWLQRELGLRAYRYSLGIECQYYTHGNHDKGYVDLVISDLLDILGIADRTENRRQVYKTLAAMASLKVYHVHTGYTKTNRRGKPTSERVIHYSYDHYIRLEPFSIGREIEPVDAITALMSEDYTTFDGVRIHFAHPEEFERHFYPLPQQALKLGERGNQREIQALCLGDAVIRSMVMDWTTYGGILKTPLFPTFAHGNAGDFTQAKKLGILHLAGLSTLNPSRERRDLPKILQIAQDNQLIGKVDYTLSGKGQATLTAPLWLWDIMQASARKRFRGIEPSYVAELRRESKTTEE